MMESKMVLLGDYIEQCDERNTSGEYSLEAVRGISIEKKMIYTKANMDGVSLKPYKLFKPEEFCFVTITSRNGNKITLSMNYEDDTYLVSSSYIVFKIKDKDILLPEYLYLLFCRSEFDRYARFNSWGSAREAFSYEEMCRVQIPLPSLSEQQKIVNAWKALREIKEQNEAIAAPLMQVCQSYIQELKHKYESVEIGPYVEECNNRNTDGKYGEDRVRGLAVSKGMIETKANLKGVSLLSYKLVNSKEIAFVPDTSRRGDKVSLGRNDSLKTYLVSSISCVFKTDSAKLLSSYLYLLFCRPEFDRYARFHSWGSAREAFSFEDMKRVRIPLPPLSVQQAIVNIYNCANEAKKIAAEADRMSREVCPALIQHAIHHNN